MQRDISNKIVSNSLTESLVCMTGNKFELFVLLKSEIYLTLPNASVSKTTKGFGGKKLLPL